MGAVAAIAKSVTSKPKAPPPPPTPAPTQAEVSQSAAADQEGLTTFQKSRRRGRSATILTSVTGVEGEPTLGTRSLLGQ